jgi:hypothetical protein
LAPLHLGDEEKKDKLFSEYLINYCLLLCTFVCVTTLFLISKTADWKSTVKTLCRQSVNEQTLFYRQYAPMVGLLSLVQHWSQQADETRSHVISAYKNRVCYYLVLNVYYKLT